MAALIGARVCAAAQFALAEDTPRVEGGSRGEQTYYNNAEKRAAHERAVGTLSTDPYAATIERERVRLFYIVPSVGVEIATIGTQLFLPGAANAGTTPTTVVAAPAYGVNLGWRIGHFNLGARYQGAAFMNPSAPSVNLNKVYAEIGFNSRAGRVMIFNGYIAGGWAFAVTPDQFANGAGGKAGITFDFLITRFFSLGPGLSFDVHAYNPGNTGNWSVAYGGTGFLRAGFHL